MIPFNVKQFRLDKRLLPHQLANILGVSRATAYNLETNKKLKVQYVNRLEEEYGNIDQYIIRETERKAAV